MATALVLVRNDVSHDTRILREARVLRDLGYEVLVAGVVSREEQETELDLDGIRVTRLLGRLQRLRNLVRRSDGTPGPQTRAGRTTGTPLRRRLVRLVVTVAFNLRGIGLAWRVAPELVHANDYDTMWIAATAKLLRRSRVVYDAHELWPDQDGDIGWRPWLIACEWLFLRIADATITVSPGCAEALAERYRVEPPVVVRNLPESVVEGTRRSEAVAEREPLAVYTGLVAPGRGLEEAVAALAVAPKLRLRIVGPDNAGFGAEVVEQAKTIGVANRLEIRPPVPPGHVAESIVDADIGLVLIRPTSLSHRLSLPNKLFEYLAAGLPVVATDLPVMGPVVRDEGLGEVVPPGDVAAIAEAMVRLATPERNADARERVHEFRKRVSWDRERRILEDVYASAARTGRVPADKRRSTAA